MTTLRSKSCYSLSDQNPIEAPEQYFGKQNNAYQEKAIEEIFKRLKDHPVTA